MQRATVFEHLIETLAVRSDKCEWVKKISYETAERYMKEAGARVLQTGDPYPEESVLYEIVVNERAYCVRTSRDMGSDAGRCRILRLGSGLIANRLRLLRARWRRGRLSGIGRSGSLHASNL